MRITKTQFAAILFTLIILSITANAYAVYRISGLAQQGAQAHAVNCSYRGYLLRQVADSKAFLAMTPAQRVERFGALGNIPAATIQRSLRLQEAAAASLDQLKC